MFKDVIARLLAWADARIHFRKKGLEKKVGVPVGSLSEKANAAEDAAVAVAAVAAQQALNK